MIQHEQIQGLQFKTKCIRSDFRWYRLRALVTSLADRSSRITIASSVVRSKYLYTFAYIHMVLILDGNSLRGAHVRRNICYSTCSRQLITSRAVTNRLFLPEKTHFPSCIELPSNISTIMIHRHNSPPTLYYSLSVLGNPPFKVSATSPQLMAQNSSLSLNCQLARILYNFYIQI